ncbi:cellulose synthase/poly-beta-1,6-N-acetylglucosamine synthase-like glycosyltransferase [Methanomicrobium sp. W14]|uniref:hypothetical protein n=1 Tax=Methanomicrobium sp. W14 TaxID=2817839 RepID=UPI001AE35C8C|nr:hypothetical protein [Methanomicrobium sp. W14]MBP2133120.1 cellulose synthase/poly-beta-1,6-N-acetylglucosamine synthase-like glycosyltransferase [Methanomicrobium sp. W14]
MGTGKKNIIVISLAIWILILLTFMILSSVINLEVAFVLWLIGLLVILELSDSVYLEHGYIKNLKIITFLGVIIFFVIVVLKVMEIVAK